MSDSCFRRLLAAASALTLAVCLTACGGGGGSSGSGSQPPYSYEEIAPENAERVWGEPEAFVGTRMSVEMDLLESPIAQDGFNMLIGHMHGQENFRLLVMAPIDFYTKAGDVIRVKGLVTGNSQTLNVVGDVLPQLEMTADEAEMVEEAPAAQDEDALTPAEDSHTQQDVTIQVTGVTLRDDETRVHLTVSNDSDEPFRLLPLSSCIRQNGNELSLQYNADSSDPNIAYEIPAGASVSGAMVFGKAENADMTVEIQGSVGEDGNQTALWSFEIHA